MKSRLTIFVLAATATITGCGGKQTQEFTATCQYQVPDVILQPGETVPVPACDTYAVVPSTQEGLMINTNGSLHDLQVDLDGATCEDVHDELPVMHGDRMHAYFDPLTMRVFIAVNNKPTTFGCSVQGGVVRPSSISVRWQL